MTTPNFCRRGELRFKIRVHYPKIDGQPMCNRPGHPVELSPTNRASTDGREINCAWCRRAIGLDQNRSGRGKLITRTD